MSFRSKTLDRNRLPVFNAGSVSRKTQRTGVSSSHTAKFLAELYDIELEKLANQTTQNFLDFFKIKLATETREHRERQYIRIKQNFSVYSYNNFYTVNFPLCSPCPLWQNKIMAKENSFDIVSKTDYAEITNAINQTTKEVSQRFDFKGSKATVEFAGQGFDCLRRRRHQTAQYERYFAGRN